MRRWARFMLLRIHRIRFRTLTLASSRMISMPPSVFTPAGFSPRRTSTRPSTLSMYSVTSCWTCTHAALKPGGLALILEFVPNEDRVSPPDPAMFSMVMLSNTPAGDAFTFSEFQKMCSDAGFSKCEIQPLPPMPQSLVIAQK